MYIDQRWIFILSKNVELTLIVTEILSIFNNTIMKIFSNFNSNLRHKIFLYFLHFFFFHSLNLIRTIFLFDWYNIIEIILVL